MSKLQHTQGPWEIDRGLVVYNGLDYPDALDICAVFIENVDNPSEIEKAKADARLIAAAPDMLEVLINAYCNMDSGNFKEIESVVEKATGMSITKVLEILNEN